MSEEVEDVEVLVGEGVGEGTVHDKALAEFTEALEKKRKRAERFGEKYTMSEEEKKQLRRLKYRVDNPDSVPEVEDQVEKQGTAKKARKGKAKELEIDLEDPAIQKRLQKFGPPPQGSALRQAIDAAEEKEKVESRRLKFASSSE